jgi:hypothetical protein
MCETPLSDIVLSRRLVQKATATRTRYDGGEVPCAIPIDHHNKKHSGSVMAEVAGLVLGALGVVNLFSSCVEFFDIIVRARGFSEDFDLLCTQVSWSSNMKNKKT